MSLATAPRNVHFSVDVSPDAIWHKSAPRAVRKGRRTPRDPAGWKVWRRHLRARESPVATQLPWVGKEVCVAPEDPNVSRAWIHATVGGRLRLDDALAALVWCRRLPELADAWPADAWWQLWDHLVQVAAESGVAAENGEDSAEDAAVRQLAAGELALTLACLFPEIKVCRKLLPSARRTLSQGMIDLIDGKGFLFAKHFDHLHPLLACWTRCHELDAALKQRCWSRKAERRFRRLTHHVLRLARRDGTLVFSNPSRDSDAADLLAAAAAIGGGPGDRAGANRARRGAKGKRPASVHARRAATAVLRSDRSRSAPRLTVLYPKDSCRVELAVGRDVLWSGEWTLDVGVDGAPATPTSGWTELCWTSDDDIDGLVLEIDLGPGLRVERHILLARQDRFLLLADAVLGSRPAALEYRSSLPLCSGIAFHQTRGGGPGMLLGGRPRATALPLALPADGATPQGNALSADGAGLQLRQTAEATSLFAPLFVDLDRRRVVKPHTWRRLTVAESWTVQPPEVAVGYRVAVGRRQWLVYRALARLGNRSLLGHNISSEMLVARFDRHGEVESLIEIE